MGEIKGGQNLLVVYALPGCQGLPGVTSATPAPSPPPLILANTRSLQQDGGVICSSIKVSEAF